MFCGAGGSSTGAIAVPGIEVRTAMNHWARAIETHNTNHPDTTHVQADISQTDPRYVAKSDILWASPECTNHSVAKGKKRITNQPDLFGDAIADEAADRSRATMWDVPRFAEYHDYRLIITENVVDAARWVMFDAWLMAMASLGYEHHIVYMNSMHAQLGGLPAPQSRDRMYVVFWKKGNRRPDFDRLRPRAYCPGCDKVVTAMQVFKKAERWGRYRAQYNWRCPNTACRNQVIEPGWLPAAHAIDWSLRGERIGDRTKPLAEKTMDRIRAGLEKYGQAGEPYLSLMRSGRARNYPVTDTLQTLTTEGAGHCLVDPRGLVIDAVRGANIISHTDEPLRTQTTSYTRGLLVPVEGREGKEAASVMSALRTQTTRNETGLLAIPEAYLMRNNSSRGDGSEMTTPVNEVMRTLTTAGHQSLLMPYYGSSKPQPVSDPIGTLTTVDRYAMITLRGQNAPKDVYDPMDTFAANGNHHAVMGVKPPAIEDCTFRMLEPHEVTWGMAFPKDYIMTGNKREQVKQAGNAVCPPNARDLVSIGAESLQAA
jgi:DNA (cytosine-5)-methyltransferase 1